MNESIHIDGSAGEGGGQILRTSLALSALTQTPMRVSKIRGARPRPGIKRQHLTAILALAEICDAEVRGAEINGSELFFKPGPAKSGAYSFAVGTAGSTTLVLQTVLWPLLMAKGDSEVVIEGGTHNPMAPPYDFIERCFLPVVRAMGADVEIELEAYGFAPAGGGRLVAKIRGGCELSPYELLDAGPIHLRQATALVANLPGTIAIRELRQVREVLGWQHEECLPRIETEADGPGNVLMLEIARDHVSEIVTGFGRRELGAEDLAQETCGELQTYLDLHVPVGKMLADQLIIPFALASGRFRTGPLSLHSKTNIATVRRFLECDICVEGQGTGVEIAFASR